MAIRLLLTLGRMRVGAYQEHAFGGNLLNLCNGFPYGITSS